MPVYETVDEPVPVPRSIVEGLRRLFLDTLPWHNNERPSGSALGTEVITPPSTTVTVDPEAMKQLGEYRKALNYDMLIGESMDDTKAAPYTRLGTMVLKVAMLLAAVDSNATQIRIEPCHAYASQIICERWRESMHRLDRDLAKSESSANDDNKVLIMIRGSGAKGMTIREIMQTCNIRTRAKVVEALTLLADDGLIEKYDHKPERGRPTVYYRIVGASGD